MVITGLTAAYVAGKVAEVGTTVLIEVLVARLTDELKDHGHKQPLSDARFYLIHAMDCLKEHETRTTETRV